MKCTKFRKWASSYLDHQLASHHQRTLALHLARCEECQTYLKQVRAVSQSLARLPRPVTPSGLLAETLAALDGLRQAREVSPLARVSNWALLHSRTVSAVASFLITVVCYLGILGQLKPIPDLPTLTHGEAVKLSSSQYNWVNGSTELASGVETYTFPRVEKTNQSVTSLADMATTKIVVVTLVHPDGRASLVRVLEPASTPQLVEQVQAALEALTFRPAMIGGRAVSTQLILMVERVDVGG